MIIFSMNPQLRGIKASRKSVSRPEHDRPPFLLRSADEIVTTFQAIGTALSDLRISQ
jgi:hypothetical protein